MNLTRGNDWCRRLALVCASLLLAGPPAVSAATFPELYTVSVAPDPEARNARADAIRRGMRLLLTRITGRQQAADYPEVRELIEGADRYLTLYAPFEDEIRVGFIRGAVNDTLTRLNMPIWGDERPLTLLWVAAEFADGQRAELAAAADGEFRAATVAGTASNPLADDAAEIFESVATEILTAADERGLPLVLPMLDAEDRRHVRFADVWGGFDPIVARAAERYDVDAVVIVRITPLDQGFEVNWTVRRGEQVETLTTPRARLGIDWLADEYASEYTTIGDASLARVTVRDVRTWPDFGRVLDYLDSVSVIESVDVESISGTDLVLRIRARGDQAQLARYLTLDGQLAADENADGLVFMPSWRRSPGRPPAP